MVEAKWQDLGPVEALKDPPLREIIVGKTKIALSYRDGEFGAVSGVCNHVGGPLGKGKLDGDFIECPWHYWRFNRKTGESKWSADNRVPQHELKIENGRLLLNLEPATKRATGPHKEFPLARKVERTPGPIRVVGISTTVTDLNHPRYSTSEELLKAGLDSAADAGSETRLLRLSDLKFRHCEGFYSKSANACIWPCSITRADKTDELEQVYEAIVHWADVILISTPIRWGNASSLYYKMIERMNCIQNQITIANKVLIQKKVAAFIITGGQDNIQAVAGQMLMFFAELGFLFPPFPFIAHSLGWNAENMERNVAFVQKSQELKKGATDLVRRAIEMSKVVLASDLCSEHIVRAGRKAHQEKEKAEA